jgi:hypothetical protein
MQNQNVKKEPRTVGTRLKGRENQHANMSAELFAQSVGLAHLAVDLARLALQRGDKNFEPLGLLDSAAHLVNEAARHTSYTSKEAMADIQRRHEKAEVNEKTPLSAIYGDGSADREIAMKDGSKFTFGSFTSERGWNEFLEKHYRRVLPDELKGEILERLNLLNVPSGTGPFGRNPRTRHSVMLDAVSYIKTTYWEGFEHLMEQAVKDNESIGRKGWPHAVLESWVRHQAEWSAEFWQQYWKEEGLNLSTLQSLAETKQIGNKNKGKDKQSESGEKEGTTNQQPKTGKKQAGGRKKQA